MYVSIQCDIGTIQQKRSAYRFLDFLPPHYIINFNTPETHLVTIARKTSLFFLQKSEHRYAICRGRTQDGYVRIVEKEITMMDGGASTAQR
jgi:hypothetical protein